ncbi:MAG: hypothetical protein WC351_05000, partial [Candidatus Izemoplasmatales bacterium]
GDEAQIDKDELIALMVSLKMLEISDFGDQVDVTKVTTIFLDPVKPYTFLESGSLHTTIDFMIKGNPNIGASIPELAQYQVLTYGIADMTTEAEIILFIRAADAMPLGTFTDVDFSFAGVAGMDSEDRDTILSSMIVRNKITPDVEAACAFPQTIDPFGPAYVLDNDDYMNSDPSTFLTKAAILDVIAYYYG